MREGEQGTGVFAVCCKGLHVAMERCSCLISRGRWRLEGGVNGECGCWRHSICCDAATLCRRVATVSLRRVAGHREAILWNSGPVTNDMLSYWLLPRPVAFPVARVESSMTTAVVEHGSRYKASRLYCSESVCTTLRILVTT